LRTKTKMISIPSTKTITTIKIKDSWSSAIAVIADRTGELSNRFRDAVTSLGLYKRLVRNPILPSRVYERTQTQSTQAWLTKVHVRSQSIRVHNMLQARAGMVVCVSKKLMFAFSLTRFWCVCGQTIHPTAKVSQGTHRNLPARNTLVQLFALYTNPQSHNAQRHRQTHGQTDGRHDDANSQSYILCSSTIG